MTGALSIRNVRKVYDAEGAGVECPPDCVRILMQNGQRTCLIGVYSIGQE